MSPHEAEKSSRQFFRWIAMPFAAVLGSFLGTIAYSLMGWIGFQLRGGTASKNSFFFTYFMPISASIIFGFLFAYIVCKVSPKYKLTSGIVMTSILILTLLFYIFNEFYNPMATPTSRIRDILGTIGLMISSISILVREKHHSDLLS